MKEKYDVVLETLRKERNLLWKMTERNMNSEYIGLNIMDDIRLRQIEEIDQAIKLLSVREEIKEVIRISDRDHPAWNKVKEAL